jgi:hypothetical protein
MASSASAGTVRSYLLLQRASVGAGIDRSLKDAFAARLFADVKLSGKAARWS